MIVQVVKILFASYNFFIIARIIGSWIPQIRYHNIMRFFSYYTDPYLNIFRRIIPPVGGILDFSPLIGILFLQMLEKFILFFFK